MVEVSPNVTDKILTLREWQACWRPIDPTSPENAALSLNAYAEKCDAHKRTWAIPWRFSSNGRYAVYIEGLLREQARVPDEIIGQIGADANRYHDVPLVGARQAVCAFRKLIDFRYSVMDFDAFCALTGFGGDYASLKWQKWQELVAALNVFDSATLAWLLAGGAPD